MSKEMRTARMVATLFASVLVSSVAIATAVAPATEMPARVA